MVAAAALGVNEGCSARAARNVFSWILGRRGSAGHSAAILRRRCCACLSWFVVDIAVLTEGRRRDSAFRHVPCPARGCPRGPRPGRPKVWPRAFYFSFQAEDAFLPVRAALNVEPACRNSPTAPAALPTSEMAWENRFIMVGHDGPAPYLMCHQACHTAPLTRLFLARDCSGLLLCLLCIAASCSSQRVYHHDHVS